MQASQDGNQTMTNPSDLHRFVAAQDPLIDQVRDELRRGAKRSHWMWFVFPQLRGLGDSPMAQRYALASGDEASRYLEHPVLGPRLLDCTALVLAVPDRSANRIFGSPDDLKFHSSMTLFSAVAPDQPAFRAAIDRHFAELPDQRTLDLLRLA